MIKDRERIAANMLNKMAHITRERLSSFDDAGGGMYNLDIGHNPSLSFDNSQGILFQIYPFEEKVVVWLLNYHDNDHEDIMWDDLTYNEKKIIYKMFLYAV